MSADSDAFQTVKQLGLSPQEEQYLLTVARGEGFYGLGWGNNPKTLALSEEMGVDGKAGVGSHNWGAIQGTGPAGSFPHIDHHADGSPYIGKYRKYNTSAEGAADMARILLKPNVKASLALGDLRGAVFAQHANRYFELAPEKYLTAVKRNYGILTERLKWPVLLSDPPPTIPAVGMIAATPLVGCPSSELRPESSGEPWLSSPTLRLGSSGIEVKILQQLLTKNGYPLAIDGSFGRLTDFAVRAFQKKHSLRIDGIVGPITWKKLYGSQI